MGNLIRMPHSELHSTVEILDALGVEPKDFERVRQDRVFAERVAQAFKMVTSPTEITFRVLVDYSRSLEEMIAAGKYDWRNEDIAADHFSVVGKGKAEVELTLVHFNRAMSTDDVLREFKKSGLRPGKTEELLALGAKHPDLQREFPIVELGSVWRNPRGSQNCACLWGGGSERNLGLGWLGSGWGECYRFLAVRES